MDKSFSRLVGFLDSRLRSGRIEIIDWDRNSVICGPAEMPLVGAVELKSRSMISRMITNPALAVGVGYADGDWSVVEGDLVDIITALRGGIQLPAPVLPNVLNRARKGFDVLLGRKSDLKNIDFHYNIGNEFYELWLDSEMFYSCAYFENPSESLESAQQAKARRIAAKLNLRPGDRVLDIGCGWGGMAFYLARNFDVQVTGISLAKSQVDYSRARAAELRLDDNIRFELCDYRSAEGSFDAIVSIGMLEHVGKAHLADMFKAVDRLLKPDGSALVHTIGSVGKDPSPNPWVDRYIFPGGHIPSLNQITTVVAKTPLLVSDVETLRMHYAWTLNAWRCRFIDAKREITSMFGERFFRVWDFYLAISEASFRAGIYVNFQVQLTKAIDSLPFTRDYMSLESPARSGH
jgi:cyclopropane-fatty-acyl-phospholipid synthase